MISSLSRYMHINISVDWSVSECSDTQCCLQEVLAGNEEVPADVLAFKMLPEEPPPTPQQGLHLSGQVISEAPINLSLQPGIFEDNRPWGCHRRA